MRTDLRRVLRAAAAAVLVALVLTLATIDPVKQSLIMGDFRAFYCAGALAAAGADPYAAAPLSACESSAVPRPLFAAPAGDVLPAPLPGYLIAVFAAFARLPFAFAACIWLIVLIGACAGAIAVLARLRIGRPAMLAAAFAIPLFAVSLPVGELPPLALCGLALLAVGARHRRPWLCAAGTALTFTEPQIGIAAGVAALALGLRLWIPVCLTGSVLVAASVAAIGAAASLSYVTSVLPAHTYAELPRVTQYSLSWMVSAAGSASSAALTAGRVWYVVMIVAAAWIARSPLARRAPDFAILAAGACAVTLGIFVHLDHIVLAMPAALWLASRTRRLRTIFIGAAIALAAPVLYILAHPLLIVPVAAICGWIAAAYARSARTGLRSAATTTIALAAIEVLVVKAGVRTRVLSDSGSVLPAAQASWAHYVRTHDVMTGWPIWIVKLPTWLGVLIPSAGAGILASRSRKAKAVPRAGSPAAERSH